MSWDSSILRRGLTDSALSFFRSHLVLRRACLFGPDGPVADPAVGSHVPRRGFGRICLCHKDARISAHDVAVFRSSGCAIVKGRRDVRLRLEDAVPPEQRVLSLRRLERFLSTCLLFLALLYAVERSRRANTGPK
jgi:hypothetical protein